MKTLFLAAFVLLQTVVFAQTTWTLDKAHSRLGFSLTHMGVSDAVGSFKDFDVTVTTNKADFSDATFDVTVNVATINTELEMRDEHLRGADYFDVANHPKLTFKSTAIKAAGKGKFKLTGTLTLRGVSKTVTLDVWYRGTIENPMSKKPTAGFQITGKIKRSDFKVGEQVPATVLGDEITLKADGEFNK